MKILLTGASGQLGRSIKIQKPKDLELITLSKFDLNILDKKKLSEKIKSYKPDWVINAAAYTNVDDAETNKELALKVNRDGPKFISEILSDLGGNLLHISTDFVFDGFSSVPYKPNDKTNPISVYGNSKLLGEKEIEKIFYLKNRAIILRTSWLMGPYGNNFANTMLNLHKTQDTISVVKDQIGCPTSTFSLANICWRIINKKDSNNELKLPFIMHWCDKGVTNWYEIANEIGNIGIKLNKIQRKAKILPIKTNEYPYVAQRPLYSVLDIEETEKKLNINALNWKKSLLKSFKNFH